MIDVGLGGRVTLVTGATDGLGRMVARLFAAQGGWIAVCFRADYQGAKSLVDEIRSDGGRALVVPGDVRTPEGAWAAARYVEHEWAQIDVLVHAAGLVAPDDMALDPMPLISELVPGMLARHWGRVVVLTAAGSTDRSELLTQTEGQGLLINTLRIPADVQSAQADEVARCALFFGSAWNGSITGAELDICSPNGGNHAWQTT